MSKEFIIDEEKLKLLASSFNISEKDCKDLFGFYRTFVPSGTKGPLFEHIIKKTIKEKTKNTIEITFQSLPKECLSPNSFGFKYVKGSYFTILFSSALPQNEKKIIQTKELWRLFFLEMAEYISASNLSVKKHSIRLRARLFGIFTIADENCSYQNRTSVRTFQDLVNIFKELR